MSTRGSIGFRVNGVDKLTYNHSDSYPSGLGQEFVSQCRKLAKIKSLNQRVDKLVVVNDDVPPTTVEIEKLSEWANLSVDTGTVTNWYCLLHKTQGDLTKILKAGYMLDGNNFILDSLFCEYAYILNLDDGTLEFYRGFNQRKNKNKGRYSSLKPLGQDHREGDYVYYGCTLVGSVPLNNIPKNTIELIFPKGS